MKKQEKIDGLQTLRRFVESDRFGKGFSKYSGLCPSISYLYLSNIINEDQKDYLYGILPKRQSRTGYCWEWGLKEPRIGFIDGKLKELKKEKK